MSTSSISWIKTVDGHATTESMTSQEYNATFVTLTGSLVVNDQNNNVNIGTDAGASLTSGTENIFFGYEAGTLCTAGSRNVACGYRSGSRLTTATDNVVFGVS